MILTKLKWTGSECERAGCPNDATYSMGGEYLCMDHIQELLNNTNNIPFVIFGLLEDLETMKNDIEDLQKRIGADNRRKKGE
jgi:hypothetical protein